MTTRTEVVDCRFICFSLLLERTLIKVVVPYENGYYVLQYCGLGSHAEIKSVGLIEPPAYFVKLLVNAESELLEVAVLFGHRFLVQGGCR